MPIVMTKQENRHFSSFHFVSAGIFFSNDIDFELSPSEIIAILPDLNVNAQKQSVNLWCGMAVARLLLLGHMVKTLGFACSEVLLVGGLPLWLAYRLPFSDIDFIVSKCLVKPLYNKSLHSIQRPKLDLQAGRPLEAIITDEDLTPIPLRLGNEYFNVVDPISAVLGNLRVLDTQRFKARDLPLIYKVLQLQGASGLGIFRRKLERVTQNWHFFPKEKGPVMSNYNVLLQALDSITSMPSFPSVPSKATYELTDFFD